MRTLESLIIDRKFRRFARKKLYEVSTELEYEMTSPNVNGAIPLFAIAGQTHNRTDEADE